VFCPDKTCRVRLETLMEFGLFSNGFRPHTSAGATYNEDIAEIVLADELGFRDAYISEHHGELPYIDAVDVIPTPEFLMCKAAGLTSRIRMGAAVKLIHLHHPVDVAIQAAVTSHMLGPDRFIFGFGTGFSTPLFSAERGLSFDDRQARMLECLEGVIQCWSHDAPFDLSGRFWNGTGIITLPKPRSMPMPMAVASASDMMIKMAAERGYILLSAFVEQASAIRAKGAKYAAYARDTGDTAPLDNLSVARVVYISTSRAQAIDEMRASVAFEVSVQAKRGFLKLLKANFGLDVPNDERAVDHLVDAWIYIVGDADEVSRQLHRFYRDSGGFGTLLIVAGKNWGTRATRHRSMRSFMSDVAPGLRKLSPSRQVEMA
jgi:alkanesulfonate monooxygenase SsuD/methylene tetrahydromethanopterin reductase-like flavin-dependent oxidoreductase (luciferase family)